MKAVRRCFSSTNQERWSIPIFLCPPLGGGPLPVPPSRAKLNKLKNGTSRRQRSSLQALKAPRIESAVADTSLTSTLPRTCPGCGAYTQNFDPGDAGFYSTTRKPVKAFLKAKQSTVRSKSIEEAQTFSKVIANASPSTLQSLGFDDASELEGAHIFLLATRSSYRLTTPQSPLQRHLRILLFVIDVINCYITIRGFLSSIQLYNPFKKPSWSRHINTITYTTYWTRPTSHFPLFRSYNSIFRCCRSVARTGV